ncbi:hypothetical protein HanHA300_Chr08g0286321 [Helianthus annuus]|nr:hypothetical protein HanHA300_Chr08g0286321 [Helianthus annuus]KAJ0719745.1 hypothetical protein HanLR1_Chr08g0285161 [Helianthus annuus]KAJ0722967.1 hypothetical protein HanOQP8_Chr08g0292631 [Helianthus annuus]
MRVNYTTSIYITSESDEKSCEAGNMLMPKTTMASITCHKIILKPLLLNSITLIGRAQMISLDYKSNIYLCS